MRAGRPTAGGVEDSRLTPRRATRNFRAFGKNPHPQSRPSDVRPLIGDRSAVRIAIDLSHRIGRGRLDPPPDAPQHIWSLGQDAALDDAANETPEHALERVRAATG